MTQPTPMPPPLRVVGERIRTACTVAIAVCVVGATLAYMGKILTPLFIAIFLFFLLRPLTQALARLRVPRLTLYLVLLLLLLLAVPALSEAVYSSTSKLALRLPDYQQRIETTVKAFGQFFGRKDIELPTPPDFMNLAIHTTVGVVETSVMVLFYLGFMFMETPRLPGRVRKGFEPSAAEQLLAIGRNIEAGIKSYMVFKTFVSLGLAATTGVICWLFDMEFALLCTVITFFANYITYVGSLVALAPPMLLAFLQFTNPTVAAILSLALLANRLFWIDYVEIRYSGKHLNISPLLLLLALAVMGSIWGVVGMLLAVPTMTIAKIVLANFPHTRHWAALMSEE